MPLTDTVVRQAKPARRDYTLQDAVLEEANTQHPLQADHRLARAVVFRVERLHQGAKLRPRNHVLHLREELIAIRDFLTDDQTIGTSLKPTDVCG